MASLQTTPISCSSLSPTLRRINASIHFPKPPSRFINHHSLPKLQILNNGSIDISTPAPLLNNNNNNTVTIQQRLYAILEAITDRIQMHINVADQRNNWNSLLLNNINIITLAATTISAIAATSAADHNALKLSSTLLFSAATGMLLVMNKIQPSQLTEEQRNTTRLFKQLRSQIETLIAVGNPTEEDVKSSIDKVLALDRAYPLPLLGVMLEKFPSKFEPAVWWPNTTKSNNNNKMNNNSNGWSEELEMELRQVIEVVKKKDVEDYERLGKIALKMNKCLAIAGPLLTGIAAVGSAFMRQDDEGSWLAMVPILAGSVASVINAFEHGGQVGMVFEMYRNCGGFFKLLEETIETTLNEKDLEKRENGEMFEMKVALQLGRSVSELRHLASKSASYSLEGIAIDEFASKLF